MDSSTQTVLTIVLIALNLVLVIITAIYAFLTHRIAKSSERATAAMESQTESITRPYITITHTQSSNTMVSLSIANTGKSNAQNLRLQIDKDFLQLGGQDSNLADLFVFQNTIATFPPNAQLRFPLHSSLVLRESENNPQTPSLFSITATYSFAGKTVVEKTVLDLRMYKGIWMPHQTIEESLSQLTVEMKELKELVAKKFAS
jgi:hypothetical protein